MRRVRYCRILPAILVAGSGVPSCYSPQSVDWQGTGNEQPAPGATDERQPKTPAELSGNTPVSVLAPGANGKLRSPAGDPGSPDDDTGDAPALSALRAACDGLPYEATLLATGPNEPYALTLLDDVELTLGADGVLSGVPRGAGTRSLRVALTDAGARTHEASVELRVRDRCWVAYSSRESGALRLHVTDVLATTRKVFPAASAEQAFDFAFSPSGRHLAFRAGVAADSAALYVLRPESDAAARLGFELPVAAYAWSSSGEHLAVILAGGGDEWFLSGLAVPAGASADALAATEPWPLVPTSYRRELHWMSDAAIVHLGRYSADATEEQERLELPHVSRRDATGLGASRPLDALPVVSGDGALHTLADGFISLASRTSPSMSLFHVYYPVEASTREADGRSLLVADSVPPELWWSDDKAYAGRFDSERRFVFHAMLDGDTPRAISESRCDRVLAWRTLSDRQRVVCVEGDACPLDSTRPVLRVLDFFPASDTVTERALDGCWSTSVAADAPRDVSREGNWFVFDTGANLATIALTGPARPPRHTAGGSGAPHQRAYLISPDEEVLLWQNGASLWWRSPIESEPIWELTAGHDAEGQAVSMAASQGGPCEPEFLRSPNRWCGRGVLEARARWSTDSLSVVLRTDDGALWSADLSRRDEPAVLRRLDLASAACTNGCIESFALQP